MSSSLEKCLREEDEPSGEGGGPKPHKLVGLLDSLVGDYSDAD